MRSPRRVDPDMQTGASYSFHGEPWVEQSDLHAAGLVLFRIQVGQIQVLLLWKRPRDWQRPRWLEDLPKGRRLWIQHDLESPRSCAVRETLEETALLPIQYRILNHRPLEHSYYMRQGRKEQLCFVAVLSPDILGDPVVQTSMEHYSHEWQAAYPYVHRVGRYTPLVRAGISEVEQLLRRGASLGLEERLRDGAHATESNITRCVVCVNMSASFGFQHGGSVHLCLCKSCKDVVVARDARPRCFICRRLGEGIVEVFLS